MKIIYRRILSIVLVTSIFYFMGTVVYREWDNISAYEWSPDLFGIISSSSILFASYIMLAYGWTSILRKIGGRIETLRGIYIFLISLFGRYVPGGILSVLGRVYMCRFEGIPDSRSGMSILLEQAYPVVSSGIIFVISLLFWSEAGAALKLLPLLLFLPLSFVFLHPKPFLKVVNPVLTWFGKGRINISMGINDMLLITLYYSCYWIVTGIAFYLFIRSFYPLELYYIPILTGIYAISFTAGYLSLLAPAGLGVREGVLILLLSLFIPTPVAIGVSLLSRLWLLGIELFILILFLINRETRRMAKTALGW